MAPSTTRLAVGGLLATVLCAVLAGCAGEGASTTTEAPLAAQPTAKKKKSKKEKKDTQTSGTGTPAPPAPSSGCAKGTGGQRLGQTIDVWGERRSYDLLVPSSYDPARTYPLVFVFHGGGGSSEGARHQFDFSSVAGDDAIFVYPNGRHGSWDLESPADENADMAFFDDLVASIEASHCVDSGRVFATGYSNGAFFSNQLGCRRGGESLRGIAPHAGGGPFGRDAEYGHDGHLQCEGSPVAAMIFHGQWDDIVWHDDGQRTTAHWTNANGCDGRSRAISPGPCVAFDGCENPVAWCSVPELGHDVWWEGVKATWDFFSKL